MVDKDALLSEFEAATKEVMNVLPEDVTLDSRIEELGIDSLSFIEIIMVLEEKLDVQTKSEDFDQIVTIRDALAIFESYLSD